MLFKLPVERVRCQECKAEGKPSTVTQGVSATTCVHCPVFFDEVGFAHKHDTNVTTTSYLCSNGHEFKVEEYHSCWCGWNGGKKPKPDSLANHMEPVMESQK